MLTAQQTAANLHAGPGDAVTINRIGLPPETLTVTGVIELPDAYFRGGSAREMMALLVKTPDGVLVSEEPVNDFQLTLGDTINLRLINAADHQYHAIPFRFIGVATEFPTAPKGSFLVANAAYIAKMAGDPVAEYVLMRTKDDPAAVAQAVRDKIGSDPGLRVTDIGSVTHIVGSSLSR